VPAVKKVPVAAPVLNGNERAYVLDCLDSSWISSKGAYVQRFEAQFAEFVGSRYAIACSNGTAALHTALLALEVGPDDEVIVPTLTYVATANTVLYCGARPVFVDSEPETGNIDPAQLRMAISNRTKGIIAVHLYGHPANLQAICDVARRHNIFVVEDAAEAQGAERRIDDQWVRVGSVGDIGVFSFFGNKIVTTGEGGMLVTDNPDLYRRAKQLINQGEDPSRHYWFPMVGYNYRMTNVQAAIGLGQLERIDWHIGRRREVAQQYQQRLGTSDKLRLPRSPRESRGVYWMTCALLQPSSQLGRDELMAKLDVAGIETRPYFPPMHELPIYAAMASGRFPVAEALSRSGMNLPSSASLQEEDIDYVCNTLLSLI
jgi:perosamine synthetase